MKVYRKKGAEDLKRELKWALSAMDSLEELTRSIDFEDGIKLTGHGMASIQSIAVATTETISHALEYLEAQTEEDDDGNDKSL